MLLRFETRMSQMPHFWHFWPPVKISERWAKFLNQYLQQSFTLPSHVLDLKSFASSRHQSTSKATGVENRGQISDFLNPYKITGELCEIFSQFMPGLWPNHRYTTDGVPLDCLGYDRSFGKKTTVVTREGFPTYVQRP